MKDILGFTYTPSLFKNVKTKIGKERAIFRLQQRFPAYIWNDSLTEGKAYTYPMVKTVIDGITTGGSKLTHQQDILNQKKSLEKLIDLVKRGEFDISKNAFCSLHDVAAKEEALEWGIFRSGSVGVAGTNYSPPPAHLLNSIFEKGIQAIKKIDNSLEQAIIFFLFGAYHQFFYDGNKRTSRLMMNGVLLCKWVGRARH
ncbi:cell filamentation protein Fic [Saccharophagus sp. K07]|jgi:Fic family protein|uniref:Fic family protein n=1 Tax=Saccharophagus sp. K07 TaxID=2283636 RepID=UPI0016529FC9|nr:Fic family protein [Saccharophagus sp. K07]MBC6903909.1 cell filamentation protein Fic [Saccharophagus sp. K07]